MAVVAEEDKVLALNDEDHNDAGTHDDRRLRQLVAFSPAIAHWELSENPGADGVRDLKPHAWEFDCALLFVDISGFTDLCTRLKIDDLERLASSLPRGRGVIYLVGDSTLDNKYWLIDHGMEGACNGYEECLQPARSPPDVAHWINHECVVRGLSGELCCVNAAIEESTLGLRHGGTLLPQDAFVQSHVKDGDIVVVSCGGNDIALRPTAWTIVSIYAVGIPLGYMALLYSVRHDINDDEHTPLVDAVAFLHDAYKPRCYWWEMAVLLHKLTTVGFATLIFPGTLMQLVVVLLTTLVFKLLLIIVKPYREIEAGY